MPVVPSHDHAVRADSAPMTPLLQYPIFQLFSTIWLASLSNFDVGPSPVHSQEKNLQHMIWQFAVQLLPSPSPFTQRQIWRRARAILIRNENTGFKWCSVRASGASTTCVCVCVCVCFYIHVHVFCTFMCTSTCLWWVLQRITCKYHIFCHLPICLLVNMWCWDGGSSSEGIQCTCTVATKAFFFLYLL